MKDMLYEPSNVTISRGTSIVFKNVGTRDRWPASDIHPTHGIYSEFDPRQPLPPGDSWTFRFDKTGVWRWHDHLEPSLVGTITVE